MASELPEHLDALLQFIRGEGEWKHYGSGMATYQNGDGKDQKKHEACLELERRGLIVRSAEFPGRAVCWKPQTEEQGEQSWQRKEEDSAR